MHPFGSAALIAGGSASRPATFVTSGKRESYAESTALNLTGAKAGDHIVVIAPLTRASSPPTGEGEWTRSVLSGNQHAAFSKRLTAADLVAGAVAFGAFPFAFAVWRKPQALALRSSQNGTGTLALAGFTKASRYAGLVGVSAGSRVSNGALFPSPWVRRVEATDKVNNLYAVSIWDLLAPDTYTNGASLAVGAPSESVSNTSVGVLELLNGSAEAPIQLPGTALDFSDPANTGLWAVI